MEKENIVFYFFLITSPITSYGNTINILPIFQCMCEIWVSPQWHFFSLNVTLTLTDKPCILVGTKEKALSQAIHIWEIYQLLSKVITNVESFFFVFVFVFFLR